MNSYLLFADRSQIYCFSTARIVGLTENKSVRNKTAHFLTGSHIIDTVYLLKTRENKHELWTEQEVVGEK